MSLIGLRLGPIARPGTSLALFLAAPLREIFLPLGLLRARLIDRLVDFLLGGLLPLARFLGKSLLQLRYFGLMRLAFPFQLLAQYLNHPA